MKTPDMPILALTGPPRERGRAHGTLSSLECSAGAVCELDASDRILHTNHPFESNDVVGPGERASANSEMRLRSLVRHLGATNSSPVEFDVLRALRSRDDPRHPISRRREDSDNSTAIGYTVGSAVFRLTTPPVALIAAGPPCSTPFLEFSFAP